MGEATLIASTAKLTRQQLAAVPTPLGTATHRPVPHAEIVEALVETLSFRHIGVVTEEYAVSNDGMKMFGVLDLDTGMHGCRFSYRRPQQPRPKHAPGRRSGRPGAGLRKYGLLRRLSAGAGQALQDTSPCKTRCRSAWTRCSGISTACASRSRLGENPSSSTRRRS